MVVLLAIMTTLVSGKSKHLIVLSHGMMGTFTDLNYIENLLSLPSRSLNDDVKVFKSSKNEYSNSLKGIQKGSEELASEISEILKNDDGIETISFVGNSLGGVFARYAISLLYNFNTHSFINDIKPLSFVTIASPHLGVNYGHNYIEGDLQMYVPNFIKYAISSLFSTTGKDMFMLDELNIKDSILYKLATETKYLLPLKAFEHRRVYANLQNDFMVTLPTASFMSNNDVTELRKHYKDTYGIVTTLHVENKVSSPPPPPSSSSSSSVPVCSSDTAEKMIGTMRENLDDLGWSKVIVNIKNAKLFGIFPVAHNKIAALTKYPLYFWNIFNFYEGKFVMEDLATFLQQNIKNIKKYN